MKKIVIIVCMTLIGCAEETPQIAGSNSCAASPIVGTWSGSIGGTPDTMVFRADCTGNNSVCGSSFTYPAIDSNSGTVTVNITANNGNASCLPIGLTSCVYAISGNVLSFDCGGGIFNYTR